MLKPEQTPVVELHEGFRVVRDDLLEGGTKERALMVLLKTLPAGQGLVYGGPAQGFAQVALAAVANRTGRKAHLFVAKRGQRHALTAKAAELGAEIHEVENGYLSNVSAKALAFAKEQQLYQVPFGLDMPLALKAIAEAAQQIKTPPEEVWSVAGSGVLTRALQLAWPKASFNAVVVGKKDTATGSATRWFYPAAFEKPAKTLPPFPSVANYDAKGWEICKREGSPGALFWNVGAL